MAWLERYPPAAGQDIRAGRASGPAGWVVVPSLHEDISALVGELLVARKENAKLESAIEGGLQRMGEILHEKDRLQQKIENVRNLITLAMRHWPSEDAETVDVQDLRRALADDPDGDGS